MSYEQKSEVNPNSVEVIEKTEEMNSKNNAEDVAATFFYAYLPRFKGMVESMSSRMLKRLIIALVEVPLNEKTYDPKNQSEKDAFLIGDQLLQAKMSMIIHTLYEKMEQEKEKTNVGKEE